MPQPDFDVESLAKYLHLTPAQILRMADRGRLPGRKISGQWRFSQAQIHHWLEDRIGASDADELAQLEGVLDSLEVAPISISELLPTEAIAIPLSARTRASVISEMVELAARTGWLWDPAQMAAAVREREQLHPTALDSGVALLHPRRPMSSILGQAVMAMGRTHKGIPFGDRHGQLTDLFFLICSIDDRGHLRTLARLSQLIADQAFLERLRIAGSAEEAHACIEDFEAQLER